MDQNDQKEIVEQNVTTETEKTSESPRVTRQDAQSKPKRNLETRENNPKLFYPMWLAVLLFVLTAAVTSGGWYYFGEKYLKSHAQTIRMEQQLEFYKQKAKASPQDARTAVDLGFTYHQLGKNDEAIKELNRALKLDKKNYDAYLNLGIVNLNIEKYDDAAENLKKATKIAPGDYQGHYYLGLAYIELKMYDEASKALGEAKRILPGSADIIYNIGRIAEAEGAYKDAVDIYKEALSYDPLFKDAQTALERVSGKVK